MQSLKKKYKKECKRLLHKGQYSSIDPKIMNSNHTAKILLIYFRKFYSEDTPMLFFNIAKQNNSDIFVLVARRYNE